MWIIDQDGDLIGLENNRIIRVDDDESYIVLEPVREQTWEPIILLEGSREELSAGMILLRAGLVAKKLVIADLRLKHPDE